MTRHPNRKTLVTKEKWPLIDDWYWCPEHIIIKRIDDEEDIIQGFGTSSPRRLGFQMWAKHQLDLTRRLAHACTDGKIRAPIEVEYYNKKHGGCSIYGKCAKCDVALSNGIKFIIIMDYTSDGD